MKPGQTATLIDKTW